MSNVKSRICMIVIASTLLLATSSLYVPAKHAFAAEKSANNPSLISIQYDEDEYEWSDEDDEFYYWHDADEELSDFNSFVKTFRRNVHASYDQIYTYPDNTVSSNYKGNLKVQIKPKKGGKWASMKFRKSNDECHIKNLSPNTSYDVRIQLNGDFATYKKNLVLWTTPKPVNSINGFSWTKSPGAKGYFVYYNYSRFKGYNAYGTKVYRKYYKYKRVTKTSVSLPSGSVIESVKPYCKHNGYYYFNSFGCTSTIKQLTKIAKVGGTSGYTDYYGV